MQDLWYFAFRGLLDCIHVFLFLFSVNVDRLTLLAARITLMVEFQKKIYAITGANCFMLARNFFRFYVRLMFGLLFFVKKHSKNRYGFYFLFFAGSYIMTAQAE